MMNFREPGTFVFLCTYFKLERRSQNCSETSPTPKNLFSKESFDEVDITYEDVDENIDWLLYKGSKKALLLSSPCHLRPTLLSNTSYSTLNWFSVY